MQKTPMRTHSGEPLWYLEPHRTRIVLDDLYWGLKNQCRYGGQNDVSILAHLALGLDLCDHHGQNVEEKAYFALHDQHEAHTLDIPQGMKECIPDYKQRIELPWEKHVHESQGLSGPPSEKTAKAVKYIDIRSLGVEMWVAGWGDWQPAIDLLNIFGGPPTGAELAIGRYHLKGGLTDEVRWYNVCKAVKNYTERG